MIEICLNPDNQMLGGEVFESVDSDVHADSRDSHEMALTHSLKYVNKGIYVDRSLKIQSV